MSEISTQDELLQIAIDQSSEGIAVVNLEGYVLFLNRAFAEMHGYSKEELIGKHLSVFHSADQMPRVDEVNKQIVETGGFHGEISHMKRTGEVFSTIMQNTLIRNNNGDPVAIIGTLRDISVMKQAEEEIRIRERRLREVIDLVPHQIFVKDSEGRILLANHAVAEAYGTAIEKMLGKKQQEMHLNKEEMKIYRDEDKQVIESHQRIHTRKQPFTHHDGTVHWLETIKVPIEFAGHDTCVLGVALDITDRVKIQDALRESEERYKSLVEIAFNGVLIHQDGTILYANPQLADMFGCDANDYIGQSVFQFVLPESLPAVLNQIQHPTHDKMEITGVRRDGSKIIIDLIGTDCMYQGQKARIGAVKDVTQQRTMEKELQKAKDSAMLYLDLMCHDIRNQLQIMLGYTTLAEEVIEEPKERPLIDNIEQSIRRCDTIIQKVNVTEEIMALPLNPIDLEASLREVVTNTRSTYPTAIVDLNIEARSAIIRGNKLLYNVISNVVENAIEHNDNNTRHVWIELKEHESGYELNIMDNGSGLDDAKKQQLLDIQRRYGGVGLHLVKRITERLDGTIRIVDRVVGSPTSGAKFILWFPKISKKKD
jgi:PAS domain S-box-containing protein